MVWDHSVEVSCENCKKKAHMAQMMFGPEGELVCHECYDKEYHKYSDKKDFGRSVVLERREKRIFRPTDRVQYVCSSCGFKFSRNRDSNFRGDCPYCGKRTLDSISKPSAQDILDRTGRE
ncbi:hypothetical protein KY339_01530 [Candidatus Woesearchaeota archaeon]|nr:hypothetical protein [Candidatus Woesearchaeota archaeon]